MPSVARAQGSTGELANHHYRFRILGDVAFFRAESTQAGIRSDEWILSSGAKLNIEVGNFQSRYDRRDQGMVLQLDLQWRGFYSSLSVAGDEQAYFRVTNPYFGMRHGYRSSDILVRYGVGVTAPLTNGYDDFRTASGAVRGYFLSGATGGNWDGWLWFPLTMSLVGRGDFEYRPSFGSFGVEFAGAGLFPVEYDGVTGDTLVALQGGTWAAGRFSILALGARFQAVALINAGDGGGDDGYLALIPFARIELDYFFIEARLLMNLDDPLGFAFDEGGIWALRLLAGGTF